MQIAAADAVPKTVGHTPPLNVRDAATFLGCSESFLNNARISGGGPAFIKVGRAVRYAVDDLQAWLASRRRTSTSKLEVA